MHAATPSETKKNNVRIILTGGGTAGHVMPHIALLPFFEEKHWQILYVGSDGIERSLALAAGLDYQKIYAGKLRRYFSWQNFTDVFKLFLGVLQSFAILWRFRPQMVFSKGGFVSVPVAFSARVLGIPVITHESDLTPGLANRLIAPLASKILYSFPESKKYLPVGKSILSGLPIRADLFLGKKNAAISYCQFDPKDDVKTVLVMGGSLGAQPVNDVLVECLDELTKKFRVIHLCGRGKMNSFTHPRYRCYEFIGAELKDILALADFVISRAGANSIFELLALHKPMLLIPFIQGSRGDQVDNAKSFLKNGWALILEEKDLTPQSLQEQLEQLQSKSEQMIGEQRKARQDTATRLVFEELRASLPRV